MEPCDPEQSNAYFVDCRFKKENNKNPAKLDDGLDESTTVMVGEDNTKPKSQ